MSAEGEECSAAPKAAEIRPSGNAGDCNGSANMGDSGSTTTADIATNSGRNSSTSSAGAVPRSVGGSGSWLYNGRAKARHDGAVLSSELGEIETNIASGCFNMISNEQHNDKNCRRRMNRKRE